jgi:magnesium-transporting ATPase (P-type)
VVLCRTAFPCDLQSLLCQDLNQDQVTVHLLGKSRLFNLCGLVAYLGLAVCVFTWGLQYKLSLYDPPQAHSHQIPQAKLLSKNEQIGTTESSLVIQTKTSARTSYIVTTVFFVLLLALSVLNPQGSSQREQRTNRVWHIRRGLFDIFFVRPPPILA